MELNNRYAFIADWASEPINGVRVLIILGKLYVATIDRHKIYGPYKSIRYMKNTNILICKCLKARYELFSNTIRLGEARTLKEISMLLSANADNLISILSSIRYTRENIFSKRVKEWIWSDLQVYMQDNGGNRVIIIKYINNKFKGYNWMKQRILGN